MTPNLEFRWSDRGRPAPGRAPVRHRRRHRQPRHRRHRGDQGRPELTFYPREGLNTLYVGLNNTIKPWTNESVRQAIAMGIDRQRIVDNFYPPGSEVATHFTPVLHPRSAASGDATWSFDPTAAKALLAEAEELRRSRRPQDPVPSGCSRLPARPARDRHRDLEPAQDQPRHQRPRIDLQESGTFLDANAAGTLDGLFLLGWGADYPDVTNFLDYHFGGGSGEEVRRTVP